MTSPQTSGQTLILILTCFLPWNLLHPPTFQAFQIFPVMTLLIITLNLPLVMTDSRMLLLLFVMRSRGHAYFTSLMSRLHGHPSCICWFTTRNTALICFGRNYVLMQTS